MPPPGWHVAVEFSIESRGLGEAVCSAREVGVWSLLRRMALVSAEGGDTNGHPATLRGFCGDVAAPTMGSGNG